jgi:hypothetical protein
MRRPEDRKEEGPRGGQERNVEEVERPGEGREVSKV